ncbi:OTU deubiquitinase with linear linkage specificity a [Clupea harengus]|uniref:OTU deubiquitinase with linear linkage specificity a n=1 Tax=Clupea harengus TaxID=7950 RepID=A0A6P3VFZ9_CLUHA|nr:OTU deubiquitinase with linear linkage specificity a [Clupea harengus]
MSWVKLLASGSEDVFDEDTDDLSLQNKEWNHNMEKRVKDGYRDGVDAGKEASLQVGFNEGYREGAIRMKAFGQLKGIVSALQCWCQRQALGSSASASISSLMQDVVQHEEAILEAMKRAQERPIPSVGDVSEGVEDLEMAMDQEPPEAQACSKTDCCKKDTHCSKEQSACSSIALVGLEELVTRCANLATELELPEEFVCHIQQLKTYGH